MEQNKRGKVYAYDIHKSIFSQKLQMFQISNTSS